MAALKFEGCCYPGYQYVTVDTSWVATGGTATTGLTYHFSGDPVVPNGCYTIVSAFTSGFSSTTFTQLTGVYTLQTNCSDTLCATGDCCYNISCISIPLNQYSGISGTYRVSGNYNGYPFWTGGTTPGYLFFDSAKWCLSSGFSSTCIFYGSEPTTAVCPDIDETITYSGTCFPTPTPYDPCSILDFDIVLECAFPTPTPSPTPTPTPTPTSTPAPTADVCSGYTVSVSFSATTPTPTATPVVTPTPTPTIYPYNINSGVTFVIDSGNFVCVNINKLIDCNSSDVYFVSGPIIYSGSPIVTGTTILGLINDQYKCLTYTENVFGSPADYLQGVISASTSGCSYCTVPAPTPTPTPTPTSTPTPTATPISTPTYPSGTVFVFTSCTDTSMIIQYSYPPYNVSVGNILKTVSGECYSYVGNYVSYTPPSGYIWSYVETFTATTATTYTNCVSCLIPTPTPTQSYSLWRGYGEFSVSCPVCELTNGGSQMSFYTSPLVSVLQTGVYIYEDQALTTPVIVDYIKYSTKIFNVDINGRLTEFCTVNGNC